MQDIDTTSPILVMVFAGNCDHCTRFKDTELPLLESQLKAYNGANAIKCEIEKIGDKLPKGVPVIFNKYVGFYPTFILMQGPVWVRAEGGKNPAVSDVLIYGAIMTKDGIKSLGHNNNAANIMLWVKANVDSMRLNPVNKVNTFNYQKVSKR